MNIGRAFVPDELLRFTSRWVPRADGVFTARWATHLLPPPRHDRPDPTTRPDQPDHGKNPTTDPTTLTPCQAIGSGGVVGSVGLKWTITGS